MLGQEIRETSLECQPSKDPELGGSHCQRWCNWSFSDDKNYNESKALKSVKIREHL